MSHFHVDHVGGVAGVLRGRQVGAVLVPRYAEPAYGRGLVLDAAAATGVPVATATPGEGYTVGDLTLTVLGPLSPLTGTRSDANNNSLTLRATVRGGPSVLLCGDAAGEEQRALVSASARLRADVLKVAHHGSARQDVEFLTAVHPAVALVSVGVGNEYGHPNGPLLDRLRRDGAVVARTDEGGDLAVTYSGGRLAVVARGREPGS